MKSIVQRINCIPYNEKAFTWIKLITITGGAQLIVQIIGLVSGIMVIRLLPTYEYGLYTLANTMLGTMTVLADGGISLGVMSQGGKVWQDKGKLGVVLATGLDLRKKFAIGSLLIAIPFLLYLLRHHNASWLMSFLIIVSLIPAFFTALSGSLLQIAPLLNQDIGPLQKNSVISNIARLALTFIMLFAFPWAFIAVLAAGMAQFWANLNLKKISAAYADWKQAPNPGVRIEILSVVKRTLPGSVYYCLSGQINIWLISVFGSTSSIAQIGGLGRISMILSILGSLISVLVLPRFAKLANNADLLFKRLTQILTMLIVACIIIIGSTWVFSTEMLWILGKNYAHLETELVINIIGACIGTVCGVTYGLFVNRGWIINPIISISVNILSIIIGASLINLSTVKGILWLNIFVGVVVLIMNLIFITFKIKSVIKE